MAAPINVFYGELDHDRFIFVEKRQFKRFLDYAYKEGDENAEPRWILVKDVEIRFRLPGQREWQRVQIDHEVRVRKDRGEQMHLFTLYIGDEAARRLCLS